MTALKILDIVPNYLLENIDFHPGSFFRVSSGWYELTFVWHIYINIYTYIYRIYNNKSDDDDNNSNDDNDDDDNDKNNDDNNNNNDDDDDDDKINNEFHDDNDNYNDNNNDNESDNNNKWVCINMNMKLYLVKYGAVSNWFWYDFFFT